MISLSSGFQNFALVGSLGSPNHTQATTRMDMAPSMMYSQLLGLLVTRSCTC